MVGGGVRARRRSLTERIRSLLTAILNAEYYTVGRKVFPAAPLTEEQISGFVAACGFALLPRPGLHVMLLIGAALQGATYLASPMLALMAERDVRARRVLERQPITLGPQPRPRWPMAS